MHGWYLIQTKPKQEDRAVATRVTGINAFCPKVFCGKIIGKAQSLKRSFLIICLCSLIKISLSINTPAVLIELSALVINPLLCRMS